MGMLMHIIAFLVMINPFALFLYVEPLRKDLNQKHFLIVLFKASLISFGIFALFALTGNFVFQGILQIEFESFRIFGGVILFSFAYMFIVRGEQAFIQMKEDLDDLASEIALPFMIGAGTISLSVLLGEDLPPDQALLSLVIILTTTYLVIVFLKSLREQLLHRRLRIAFDKNMVILLRLNGFFVGAIGVDMVVTGVTRLFF